MPTPLKCSNCGAPLSVPDGQRRVVCTYCGATSELPADPPAARPEPVPVTVVVNVPAGGARPRKKDEGVSCFVVLAAVAALGAAFVGVVTFIIGGNNLGESLFEHMQWDGTSTPLLVDLDGDGDNEIVGLVRFYSDDATVGAVAAFEPEDGDRLWVTRVEDVDANEQELAYIGGRLWLSDARGQLRALDPKTGTVATTTTLGEKLDRFCGDGRGGLVARLRDGSARAVDLRTGAVSSLPKPDREAPCLGGFWASEPGATPTTRLDRHLRGVYPENVLPAALVGTLGLDALFTVDGGPSYFLAVRQPGTPVPVVVARDALGNVIWTADVPSGDPLVADTGAPSTLGVGPGRVYVPWALRDGETPTRIAAFEAATGRRLWDAPLTDDTGDPSAIVSDGPRVYVSVWTWLHVLDAETGEILHTIGRW